MIRPNSVNLIVHFFFSRPLSPNALYVMAGNFSGGVQNVKHVTDIFVHPTYNERTYENNMALIKVNQILFSGFRPFFPENL